MTTLGSPLEKVRQLVTLVHRARTHPLTQSNVPAALGRIFKWHVASATLNHPAIIPFVNHTVLISQRDVPGSLGNYYFGMAEYEEMSFILHFLQDGDLFCDVGANIGAFSVLASAVCRASSVAFEPAPAAFTRLLENLRINAIEALVEPHQVCLGAENGTIDFTADFGVTNHVAVAKDTGKTIKVPMVTLDTALDGRVPLVLKVDVEGYEEEVLRGATRLLEQQALKVIIAELVGLGDTRYGGNERQIAEKLQQFGFAPYRYLPASRELEPVSAGTGRNTTFMRDLEFVREKVKKAPKFTVMGKQI